MWVYQSGICDLAILGLVCYVEATPFYPRPSARGQQIGCGSQMPKGMYTIQ
jgi:hypothetical protein